MTDGNVQAPEGGRLGFIRRAWRRVPQKYEIGIRVFDKVLLGGLLVLAGFFANNYIVEPDRADRAFEQSFAEVRVQKVSVVWSHLDEIEARLEDYQTSLSALNRKVARAVGRGAMPSQAFEREFRTFDPQIEHLRQLDASLHAKIDKAAAILARNRFWIGDDLYPQYVEYWERQRGLLIGLGSAPGINEECSGATGEPEICESQLTPLPGSYWNALRRLRASLDSSRDTLVRSASSPP